MKIYTFLSEKNKNNSIYFYIYFRNKIFEKYIFLFFKVLAKYLISQSLNNFNLFFQTLKVCLAKEAGISYTCLY